MLKEQGEKASAEDRGNIESAISNLREALKGDDAVAIRRAIENLEKSSHKMAEDMYKQAAAAEQQAATPPPEQPKDDQGPKEDEGGDAVIDAEYEVKE